MVKSAILFFWVFLSIFLHEITLYVIDTDNIGCLEPFLPLWEHFWNSVSVQLNCASDLTPRHNKTRCLWHTNGVFLIIIPNHFPQWAKVSAQITANHKGFFEFRLCPQNGTDLPASESCMDRCGCLLNAIILVSILLCFYVTLLPSLKRHTLIGQNFVSIITISMIFLEKACFGGPRRRHALHASLRHRF